MSNLSRTIAVPTTAGSSGASQDCSTMSGAPRTFIFVGTAGDEIDIEVANTDDSAKFVKLATINGAKGHLTVTGRWKFVRCTRVSGTTSASLELSGAEETNQTGPAGPVTFGAVGLTGTASTTDATATQIISFTPGDNGVYSMLVHLVGKKDDGSAYAGYFIALWKKVSGTLSAIGVTAVGEATSDLDPGTATATAAAGVAKFNVVGLAATNITWSAYGALGVA